MDNPDTTQRADSGQPSRRALLRALGIGGTAAGTLALSARPAAAQDTSTTTAPVPTTAAPPAKPDAADLVLVGLAKVVELTAATAYSTLDATRLAVLGYDNATSQVLTAIGAHHRAYAEALSAMYGPGSPSEPSAGLLATLGAEALATGDAATVLATAQAIEETAVDTHLSLLEALQATNAAALIASMQITEARHAAVLARLRNQAYDATAPAAEDGADALTAADITGGL